jgi:hypothetical protein
MSATGAAIRLETDLRPLAAAVFLRARWGRGGGGITPAINGFSGARSSGFGSESPVSLKDYGTTEIVTHVGSKNLFFAIVFCNVNFRNYAIAYFL